MCLCTRAAGFHNVALAARRDSPDVIWPALGHRRRVTLATSSEVSSWDVVKRENVGMRAVEVGKLGTSGSSSQLVHVNLCPRAVGIVVEPKGRGYRT